MTPLEDFPWLRYLPRLILLAAVLLAMPGVFLANMMLVDEVDVARENYTTQVDSLRQTTISLEASEHRLNRLTSSMSAVEQEVRSNLRLIKPGERLVLVEFETGK
ncbi:MAG: hypothetical protein JJU11_00465 [Candidatus Sumerlaeia bacterium]|nr:hypothetical protein [Candidatus Sumerlaeia bacterium]